MACKRYFETSGMRLLTGEIIYTDPLNADTDGDGLKDGEEITPQFKFVDSSSIGLPGFSCGIYFKMNSDPNMSDSDGDGIGDKNIMEQLYNSLHKLYTSISGDNTDYGNYDLLVHIDAAHKDDEYSSYLWLDSNMSLMESPKIYNGDSVEIVQTNFLGWPIKTLTKLSICNSCSVSDKYKEFFEQFFIKNKLNWD